MLYLPERTYARHFHCTNPSRSRYQGSSFPIPNKGARNSHQSSLVNPGLSNQICLYRRFLLCLRHEIGRDKVVYHEFAHIIDMYDGRADGTPMLSSKEHYRKWVQICTKEFFSLKERSKKAKKSFLSAYGATDEPEFFAVATEYFFDKPLKLIEKHHSLYKLLAAFYNQDPVAKFPR